MRVVLLIALVFLTSVYSITRAGTQHVQAASPTTLNFQARLLTSSGNLVPDGIYNVEFKLYNASTSSGSSQGSCTGDANCLWTETRLTSDPSNQQIQVKNGYLSAYLGDKTSLPTNIWNQQLYLTMNIGGTSGPTWDGEMTPRIRLTSVPFAFRATVADSAETLQKNTGSFTGIVDFSTMTADRKFLFPDTSLATTASPGTICVYNGATSNCPAATGSAYYIHNDTGLQTTANFNIQGVNDTGTGTDGTVVGILRGAAGGQTVDLMQFQATGGTVLAAVTAAGNLKVASSIDTYAAGALAVGNSTATSVSICNSASCDTISIGTNADADTINVGDASDTLNLAGAAINLTGDTTLTGKITLAGGAVDITTGTNEDLTLDANGTGKTILSDNTDVSGSASFATRAGTTFTTPGTSTSAALNGSSLYLLDTSAGAQIIQGITAGRDGQQLTLVSADASLAVTLANNNGLATGSKIITGTGGDLTLPVGASVTLIYDSANSVWRVIGSVALSGGAANQQLSNLSGTIAINQALTPNADNTIDLGSSSFSWKTLYADTSVLTPTIDTDSAVALNIGASGTPTTTQINLNQNVVMAAGKTFTTTSALTSLTGATTGDALNVSNSTSTGNIAVFKDNATAVLTIADGGGITGTGTYTFSGVATDITSGTNEDLTVVANGTGTIILDDNTTIGASAGSGTTFTNNGSTVNSTLAVADDSDGGALGGTPGTPLTAAQSVDIYTSISVSQTTANQTVILPTPTANTVYGRIIYLSNIGTASFTLLGSTLNPGATATIMWANTNGGASWVFAGADGNSILNQKTAAQNGDFWIQSGGSSTGIGRADGAILTPTLDTATGVALNIGASGGSPTTTQINLNQNTVVAAGKTFSVTSALTNLVGATTGDALNVNNSTSTGNIAVFKDNGTAVLTIADGGGITGTGTYTFSGVTTDITTGTNEDLTVVANGTGIINLNDSITAGGTLTFSGVATDITTATNEDLTVVANGTGVIVLNDSITANGTVTFSGVATDITTATNEDLTVTANGTGTIVLDDNTTIGASAGSGTTFTNNGSTVVSTLALGDTASGPIGTAAVTVDVYTSISVAQTTTLQTLIIPTPTANTVYGRVIYISNIGTASFTLLGSTLNPGATATIMWANTNGGASWVFAGADGSSILNQKTAAQNGDFWIQAGGSSTGIGRADGGLQAPTFDTATNIALGIGTTYATNITIGRNAGTLLLDGTNFDLSTAGVVTLQGGQTADLTTQANQDLTIVANGTGTIKLNDTVTVAGTMTFSGVTTDITTGTNEDLTIDANGTGSLKLNDNIVVAIGKTLTLLGDTTANRPGSPTDGMMYFDTSTKQLLVYSSSKNNGTGGWQADGRTATFIVAASNSSQSDKDAAQYIANGEDSSGSGIGTLDGDQIEINYALSAASSAGGGVVYLAPGTYTVDGSISVPNNITLAGAGPNSLIQLGNFGATSTSINAIVNSDTATGTNVTIRDLKLDGRGAINTAGGQYGVAFSGMGSNTAPRPGGRILNIVVDNFHTYSLSLFNSSSNLLSGITSTGSVGGLNVSGASNTNMVTNNNFTGGTFGIVLNSGGTLISNNVIKSSATAGIYVASSLTNITGNVLTDIGGTTTNNAIYLASAGSNTITNNSISDSSCTVNCWAIVMDAGSGSNYLADNALGSNGTINNAGTGNALSGQATGTTFAIQPSTSLTITGTAASTISTTAGNLTLQAGSGTVTLGTSTALTATGALSVSSGGANALSLDAGGAAAVNIGGTNATSIVVGRAGGGTIRVGQNGGTVQIDGTNFDLSTAGVITLAGGQTADITTADAATATGLTVKPGNSTGSNVAGPILTLQGGAATSGNANGGAVTISGGAGVGTGTQGLVNLSTTAFTSSAVQTYTTAGVNNITAGLVDLYSTIPVLATTNSGIIVSVPDPAQNTVIGRILYISARTGSLDFTLRLNASGTPIDISMKANSTATLIWNGDDWTAAGASSSTDLQAAYNNTLTSAGGAELVLNASGGAADGLTIRNNATTPITGGLLEVQTSVGSNILSVNNNATEYAANGGAETKGASNTTFPASTWTASPTGGTQATISRTITTGEFATGIAAAKVVTTGATTANQGVADQIAVNGTNTALTANLTYTVSFTVKANSNFNTLDVVYSKDGTNTATTACKTGATATESIWSRITCTFTAPSSGITSSNAIFIRQSNSNSAARTFYVDNLSLNVNANTNLAVDGSADSAANIGGGTLNWGSVNTATVAQSTSVLYDTGGSVSVTTSGTATRGVYNKLSNNIVPSNLTQYRVSFYAKGNNTATLAVAYTPDNGSTNIACQDYSTQSIVTASWTLVSCYFTTTSASVTNAQIRITQASGSATIFYVDALNVNLNNNNSNNVQIGGANLGGPTTLLTLDRSSTAPIAANNDAYLGSMYYDTTTGRIQCYEADGWGACGSSPDNIITLTPEYTGAVLGGPGQVMGGTAKTPGIGVMTSEFCSSETGILVVGSLCANHEARNYYHWTSPQATEQIYSIYVVYKLPTTFKAFNDSNTIKLTAYTDSLTNGIATLQVFRKNAAGTAVSACGTTAQTINTSTGTWQQTPYDAADETTCSFAGGDNIIFKIDMKSQSNGNVYVENLDFVYTNN